MSVSPCLSNAALVIEWPKMEQQIGINHLGSKTWFVIYLLWQFIDFLDIMGYFPETIILSLSLSFSLLWFSFHPFSTQLLWWAELNAIADVINQEYNTLGQIKRGRFVEFVGWVCLKRILGDNTIANAASVYTLCPLHWDTPVLCKYLRICYVWACFPGPLVFYSLALLCHTILILWWMRVGIVLCKYELRIPCYTM